jgi:ferric iron reductase protein FhuF
MDIMGKVKLTNYKTVLLIRKKIEKRLAKLDKKKIATKIVWSRWEFLISYLFKTIKEKSRKSKAEEGNDALIKKLKRRMRKH